MYGTSLGHTPGFDFSGEVVKCPPDCDYKVGDEVFGLADDPSCIARGRLMMGSFAEYISPPLNQVALKPPSLTHVEAAALPLVGVTCSQLFNEHDLQGISTQTWMFQIALTDRNMPVNFNLKAFLRS